jgi:UDP-N-acetylmuramyl pentapeptide phosphotransferase/UDP-N-acetylglucosamine-1-phosphate transferase
MGGMTLAMPVVVFAATLWASGRARRWLGARAILDRPVERSSHREPVPRGGGIAVVPVLLAAWLALAGLGAAPPGTVTIAAAAAALALLSWLDDLRGLPVGLRLLGHVAAVGAGMLVLPEGAVFGGVLPPLLDHVAAALLWVWFVNLFNFMDGIDGITGVEAATLGLGVALVGAGAGSAGDGSAGLALCVAAAAVAFLRWNWHRATLFLGDIGSVPLGYLLGWLLLSLAAHGQWAPALILPLYYLADASLTLLRRLWRRERFWQAHRQHFYQRALAPDGDHGAVALLVLAGDAALLALAWLALSRPLGAVALALLVVAGMLTAMENRARRAA